MFILYIYIYHMQINLFSWWQVRKQQWQSTLGPINADVAVSGVLKVEVLSAHPVNKQSMLQALAPERTE